MKSHRNYKNWKLRKKSKMVDFWKKKNIRDFCKILRSLRQILIDIIMKIRILIFIYFIIK